MANLNATADLRSQILGLTPQVAKERGAEYLRAKSPEGKKWDQRERERRSQPTGKTPRFLRNR